MTAIDNSQVLKEALLEIVDNQLRAVDPVETQETYDRLIVKGYSDLEVRDFLAAAIGIELN